MTTIEKSLWISTCILIKFVHSLFHTSNRIFIQEIKLFIWFKIVHVHNWCVYLRRRENVHTHTHFVYSMQILEKILLSFKLNEQDCWNLILLLTCVFVWWSLFGHGCRISGIYVMTTSPTTTLQEKSCHKNSKSPTITFNEHLATFSPLKVSSPEMLLDTCSGMHVIQLIIKMTEQNTLFFLLSFQYKFAEI